jgi:WS/DGAT/MGAT family acyltransferase
MAEFMQNSDAFALAMEKDARLRSTIVTVIMLDRSPDWSILLDRSERVARQMPMFRQRIVPSLLQGPPRWVYDQDFDLRYHVRRVRAPEPRDIGTVLEMARRAEMSQFDHARPLWETVLVEGLADGGAALICKVHHSLVDGIGGMQVAMILFDLEPEPADRGPLPDPPTGDAAGGLGGLARSIRHDATRVRDLSLGAARAVPATVWHGLRDPLGGAQSAAATAASVYRTIRPINETASPIMKDRRLIRELRVHEVPMATLKAAAHRGGGTLNDSFLAGVTGGLRLYHAEHGAEVGDLNLTMPVNIRTENDPSGGNRITLIRFPVPVGESDPVERIRQIHVRAAAARTERSLPYTQLIAGGLNLLPRWYIGAILRHVDFLASNVPGIPMPVYLAGAQVRMQYAFGPTIGAGVNVTLWTYDQTCALGINVDTGAIPDVDVFQHCLVEGFDEVLALADAPAAPSSRRRAATGRTHLRARS